METIRLPLITTTDSDNLDIVTDDTSVMSNVVAYKQNNKYYINQRPSIYYYTTGDVGSVGGNNRCAYFDYSQQSSYIVNDTKIWTFNFGAEFPPATNASALSSSGARCWAAELNNRVFIIDPASGSYGQGKWWNGVSDSAFYDMDLDAGNGSGTFTYFPPVQNPTPIALADGCAVIDRTAYVLTITGQIWGSDLNDVSSWTSGTNYITVEKYNDTPLLIDSHNNHVVYFGSESVQFFYDAGNATGSPLSLRQDISYKVGLVNVESYWKSGEVIYFIGTDGGKKTLYKLENFQLTPITNKYIDELIEKVGAKCTILVCAVHWAGKTYIVLSPYQLSGTDLVVNATTTISLVYDVSTGLVYQWASATATDGTFAVRHFISDVFHGYSRVYFRNGDWAYFSDGLLDYDNTGTANENISCSVKLPPFDNGNNKWKFFNSLELIGEELDVSTTVTVTWRDANTGLEETVNGTRTIDMLYSDRKIKRMGRAKRRSYSLAWSATSASESKIALEAIELEFDEGET